mgnify:CR=1 FL=1
MKNIVLITCFMSCFTLHSAQERTPNPAFFVPGVFAFSAVSYRFAQKAYTSYKNEDYCSAACETIDATIAGATAVGCFVYAYVVVPSEQPTKDTCSETPAP